MRWCPRCEESLPDGAVRCPRCGSAVDESDWLDPAPLPRRDRWAVLQSLLRGREERGDHTRPVVLGTLLVGVPVAVWLHYALVAYFPQFYLVALFIWLVVTFAVFTDAEEHGGGGLLWAGVVFVLNLPGLVLYLVWRASWAAP